MTFPLFVWLSTALADPGRILPGAEVEPAGTLELRGGLSGAFTFDHGPDWAGAGPQLLVDWAPTDRVDVEVQAPLLVVGSFHQDGIGTLSLPTLGMRVLAMDRPALRLAPTLLLGGLTTTSALFGANGEGAIDAPPRGLLLGLVGLALEAGGPRFIFDMNLSAFATVHEPGGENLWLPPWKGAIVFSDAGLRYTGDGPQELRIGLTGLFPTLTWMYRSDPLLVDLSVASVGSVSMLGAHLGRAL